MLVRLPEFMLCLGLLLLPAHSQRAIASEQDTGSAVGSSPEEVIRYQVPESEVIRHGLRLEIRVGKSVYEIQPLFEEISGQLSANERSQFLHNRVIFLESVAKSLQMIKYGIGIGAVVKDKAVFIAQKVRNKSPLYLEMQRQLSIRERADEVITAMLRGLDAKLFESSPIVARANEFGVVLSGGVEALGGRSEKGWGGLVDIGVSIGFNRDSRALVIQVFRDIEKYQSSLMPVLALGGLVSKAGFYAGNQEPGKLTDHGTSFYPPLIPGFQMKRNNFVMFGFSSGLTWPPAPLGDLLTYTNHLDHARVIRLTISPFTRGFIRFSSSLAESGPKDLRMVLEAVSRMIRFIGSTAQAAAQELARVGRRSLQESHLFSMRCKAMFTRPASD